MARSKKVQVWLYRQRDGAIEHLLLKRPADWRTGEFWQPVTGGMEQDEKPLAAARREVLEETGLSDLGKAIRTNLACFFEQPQRRFKEHIFGFEVLGEANVKLGYEHERSEWVDFDTALARLSFRSNRAALGAVHALIVNRLRKKADLRRRAQAAEAEEK